MGFTALATIAYKDPVKVAWGNSIKANDDYFNTAVARAWADIDSVTGGSPVMVARHNFETSITEAGVGLLTLTFTSGMTGSAYALIGSAGRNATNSLFVGVQNGGKHSGTVDIAITDESNNLTEYGDISVAVFGVPGA